MALKKDKQKVLGETFDDERIKTFLHVRAPAGENSDFHALEVAYRGMNADNFATFIAFFKAEGRDISSTNKEGKTLLELIKTHRHSEPYASALENA